jgi:DNA-nicking Smr family endonuclease
MRRARSRSIGHESPAWGRNSEKVAERDVIMAAILTVEVFPSKAARPYPRDVVASGKRHRVAGKAAPRAEPPPAPVVKVPFHSPFRDLASALRPNPAAPARTFKSPAPSPAVVSKPPGPASAAADPVSDAESLAASLAGVSRLAQLSPRVRIRRKPDLSHIEAKRKEDLDALARADGFDVTFEDRYVRGRAAGVSRETLSDLEKGRFAISAHLDLHGMPLEDARRAVDDFLTAQQKLGRRCVLVVTGKGKNSPGGQSVLREQVPEWLARGPSSRRVLAFASARPCDGGVGALVVLMRATSSSKNRIVVEHGGVGPR